MKHLILFFAAILLLLSCEYQDNGVTSINEEITSQYLIDGLLADNLDLYIQNNQIFRYKGKPGIVTVPIGDQDFSKYEPCFVLHIMTGTTPETIVSSAIITLDGMEVLNTSDFSKNAGQFTFEVCNIVSTSAISIEVRGEPGSYIEIWIEGKLKNTVTDADGNLYNIIKIGTQTWMKENLKTTSYSDGTPIPNVKEDNLWFELTTPAYCWYNNDENTFKSTTYGAIYNWYVTDPLSTNGKNVCPDGWHVPTYFEWLILLNYLADNNYGYNGDGTLVAKSLASTSTWQADSPNEGSPGNNPSTNNSSGFTAVAAGTRGPTFVTLGLDGTWWTSSDVPENPSVGIYNWMSYYYPGFLPGFTHPKSTGYSIRCLKNN